MQVSQASDGVANAIIGGMEGSALGIDDSPEFFHILSSTLYKFQKLAVARETISNAWDAHIAAGKQDTPIKVWIDEDHLYIQDFGKGIPHSEVPKVYGTYGYGTKRNDANSIGGFGLGCKSPLAYCDNFEITVCHVGTKTIYQMSKGSKALDGKPGITPIMQMPCGEDTGVTLRIPVKSSDQNAFVTAIYETARGGDMLVELNGDLVPKLGMGFNAGDYTVCNGNENIINLQTVQNINLRYANILYPLPEPTTGHKAYDYVATQIRRQFIAINNASKLRIQLNIQIAPNTVSVQPSRESLSETKFTLDNLAEQLNNFLGKFAKDYESARKHYFNHAIKSYASSPMLKDGRIIGPFIGENSSIELAAPVYTSTAKIGAELAMSLRPDNDQYRHMMRMTLKRWKDDCIVDSRLYQIADKLLKNSYGCRITNGQYIRNEYTHSYRANPRNGYDSAIHKWFMPVFKKAALLGLDPKRFYFRGNFGISTLSSVVWYSPMHFYMLAHRKIIIASNKKQIDDRLETACRKSESGITTRKGYLIYHVSQKEKKNLDAIRHEFSSCGFNLLDFTVRQPWEPVAETTKLRSGKRSIAVDRKVQKDNVPALSSTLIDRGINTVLSNTVGAKRITDPKFVVLVYMNEKASTRRFEGLSIGYSELLAKHFGDTGGIVASTTQQKKWINLGATANHFELMVNLVKDKWKAIKKTYLKQRSWSREKLTAHSSAFNWDNLHNLVSYSEFRVVRENIVTLFEKHHSLLPIKYSYTASDEELCDEFDWLFRTVRNALNLNNDQHTVWKAELDDIRNEISNVTINPKLSEFALKMLFCEDRKYFDIDVLLRSANENATAMSYLKSLINKIRKTHVKQPNENNGSDSK